MASVYNKERKTCVALHFFKAVYLCLCFFVCFFFVLQFGQFLFEVFDVVLQIAAVMGHCVIEPELFNKKMQ